MSVTFLEYYQKLKALINHFERSDIKFKDDKEEADFKTDLAVLKAVLPAWENISKAKDLTELSTSGPALEKTYDEHPFSSNKPYPSIDGPTTLSLAEEYLELLRLSTDVGPDEKVLNNMGFFQRKAYYLGKAVVESRKHTADDIEELAELIDRAKSPQFGRSG